LCGLPGFGLVPERKPPSRRNRLALTRGVRRPDLMGVYRAASALFVGSLVSEPPPGEHCVSPAL
jgi:hypothetical protein